MLKSLRLIEVDLIGDWEVQGFSSVHGVILTISSFWYTTVQKSEAKSKGGDYH